MASFGQGTSKFGGGSTGKVNAQLFAMDFQMVGLAVVNSQLIALRDKGVTRALRKASKEAGQIVAREARSRAPLGATGKLRRSIRPIAARTSVTVKAGNKRVPYAIPVHQGHGTYKGRKFMDEAAKLTGGEALKAYETALKELLSQWRRGVRF